MTGVMSLAYHHPFMAAERIGRAAELEALVIEGALAKRAFLPTNCFLSINVAPEALLAAPVQRLVQAAALLDRRRRFPPIGRSAAVRPAVRASRRWRSSARPAHGGPRPRAS